MQPEHKHREKIGRAYALCGYRRARNKVGGQHTLGIKEQETAEVSATTEKVWGRYNRNGFTKSGINSRHTLYVPKNWDRQVRRRDIAVVDQMLTLSAKKERRREKWQIPEQVEVFRATWVQQGLGVKIYTKEGYILRDPLAGVAVHVSDIGYTNRDLTKGTVLTTGYQRLRRRIAQTTETREKVDKYLEQFTESQLALVVRPHHSVRAGNCRSGTRDWINKNMPGRTHATVREVLTVAKNTKDRSRLAIAACIQTIKERT